MDPGSCDPQPKPMKLQPPSLRFLLFASSLIGLFAAEARDVRVRALTVAGRDPGPGVFLHDGTAGSGTAVRVKNFLNHEFEEFDLDSDKVVITTESSRKSTENPELVLAELEWPADCDSAILLFVPGEEAGKVQARLVPDSKENFPAGSYLIVNISAEPLRFQLEEEEYPVEASGQVLITDPPEGEQVAASQMQAFRELDGEWKRVAAARWAHPGSKRELHVASVNPRSDRLRVQGIKDVADFE